MKTNFKKFLAWIFEPLLAFKDKPYRIKLVEDPPDHLDKKHLYVVGSKDEPWQIEFLCPCGCQDKIVLPVNRQTSPRWDLQINKDGTPTLSPSVWRTKGCKAHFFLRRGKIQWCSPV